MPALRTSGRNAAILGRIKKNDNNSRARLRLTPVFASSSPLVAWLWEMMATTDTPAWQAGMPALRTFGLAWKESALRMAPVMFSHVVIFWTDAKKPTSADELIAGAEKYLKDIPGVLHFHIGRMVTSHRPVVDQSYQVALNLIFPDKKTQDEYQAHPKHVEFVEKCFKPNCVKVVVYDFS